MIPRYLQNKLLNTTDEYVNDTYCFICLYCSFFFMKIKTKQVILVFQLNNIFHPQILYSTFLRELLQMR